MSSRLYVQLGKTGDILNILPILYYDHSKGFTPSLMVAKEYAGLLDGVSYVKPIIFDGGAHELDKAVDLAKGTGIPFVVTQMCGSPEHTQKYVYHETEEFKKDKRDGALTDSWAKESFRAAGRWGHWNAQLPLVIDKRSPERELALFDEYGTNRHKAVLVSVGGQTAPFRHKQLLLEILRGHFRNRFQILDLDTFRAERFYDLLGLYDRARCLIAADSAPLHLARASKVPVLALINDKPSLWHGSAWRPNHIFHCRYTNFADRAMELLAAVENIKDPGCPYRVDSKKHAFIHVWSQYELNGDNRARHERARETWKAAYYRGNWIGTKIEVGAFGRDSRFGPLKDTSRFPYVRDVLAAASMRCRPDDVMVITPADVCFNGGIESVTHFPAWGTRTVRAKAGDTHSPRVDLLMFSKRWYQEHRAKIPDLIMGPDAYWTQTLKEIIRMHGGKATEDVTFREEEA